jgi:hypothetical protein
LKLTVFGVQVAALLIDFLATKTPRHEDQEEIRVSGKDGTCGAAGGRDGIKIR